MLSLGRTFQQIKTSTTWMCHNKVSLNHLSVTTNLCHFTWDVPASSCRNVPAATFQEDCQTASGLPLLGAKLHLRRIIRKVCRKVQDCAEDAAFVPQIFSEWIAPKMSHCRSLSFCIVHYLSWSFYIFLLNFPEPVQPVHWKEWQACVKN